MLHICWLTQQVTHKGKFDTKHFIKSVKCETYFEQSSSNLKCECLGETLHFYTYHLHGILKHAREIIITSSLERMAGTKHVHTNFHSEIRS